MEGNDSRVKQLEEEVDNLRELLHNVCSELIEIKNILNPKPVEVDGLYPWHRKD